MDSAPIIEGEVLNDIEGESRFQIGDRVRVAASPVHIHPGTVIRALPVRVRVEFDNGGYSGTPYRDDFYPHQLIKETP